MQPNLTKFITCLVFFALMAGCSKTSEPDTVFYNGVVISVDKQDSLYQAVAVKDGKIIHLGSSDELLTLAGNSTETIDLNGDTLIPGFVAAHEHPTLEAVFADTIDISGFTHQSAAQMWQFLESEVNKKPKGEWVFAMGIDPVLFPDMQLPTLVELDKIAPNNPLVLISQTMHSFWANTQAFREAEVTKDTPDPGHGSYYQKDENGELTGFISEAEAAAPFLGDIRSPLGIISNYQDVLDGYLASGFSSVASLGANVPNWIAKYAASDFFDAKIRQFFYLTVDEVGGLPDEVANGDDYFSILGIKLWHDGSPYTGSMQLQQPYTTSELTKTLGLKPDHAGESRLSEQDFIAKVGTYSKQGWQIAIHTQGDLSSKLVTQVMSGFASQEFSKQRHRVEHGLLITKQTLTEMAAIGITPSFHINHIYYYGDALATGIIGPQRAQNVLRVKDAFDLEMHPTLHADGPMFPAAPFHLMQTAMTRASNQGLVLGHDQAISAQQALKALTYNGAWQLGMEHKIGSIEVGKYADLVRLSENPLTTAVVELTNIEVIATWVEGEPKFQKSE